MELFNKVGLKNDEEGYRKMEFKIFNELKKLRNNQRRKSKNPRTAASSGRV